MVARAAPTRTVVLPLLALAHCAPPHPHPPTHTHTLPAPFHIRYDQPTYTRNFTSRAQGIVTASLIFGVSTQSALSTASQTRQAGTWGIFGALLLLLGFQCVAAFMAARGSTKPARQDPNKLVRGGGGASWCAHALGTPFVLVIAAACCNPR